MVGKTGSENQGTAERDRARKADYGSDPRTPIRARSTPLHQEAGQMAAPDYADTRIYHLLLQGRPQMPSPTKKQMSRMGPRSDCLLLRTSDVKRTYR